MLDNVELVMYVKFQKLLMTGCRDMDKKPQKCPQNGFFPPFVTPPRFFQISGSVTFVPLWCPNFMQKIRKNNKRSLRYLKMDGQTTDVNPGSKIRKNNKLFLRYLKTDKRTNGQTNRRMDKDYYLLG